MSWVDLVIGNALGATLLAAFAWVLSAVLRRPAVSHILWGLVLLKLVSIPLVEIEALPTREEILSRLDPAPAASPPTFLLAAREPAATPREPGPEGTVASGSGEVLSSSSPARKAMRNLPVAAAVAGTVLLIGLTGLRSVRFSRILRNAPLAPDGLQERAKELSRAFGLARTPKLRLVPGHIPPSVWPRPRGSEILLPEALLPTLAPAERDALIAHELAHVRRRDHWLRPLELAVVALWWWHPVAWWARKRLRAAEEKACDALVVRRLPHVARSYVDGLLKTVEFLAKPSPSAPALITGTGRADLQERVTMILNRQRRSPFPRPLILMIVAAGLAALLVSPGWVDAPAAQAEEEAEEETVNDVEKTYVLRMLELERRGLALEQARHELELEQLANELRRRDETSEKELAYLRVEADRLRQEGLAEAAEARERELELRSQEASLERTWLEFQSRHRAEEGALELEIRDLELTHQETQLRGELERVPELTQDLMKLEQYRMALEIRRQEAELEQLRVELQMREERLEAEGHAD